VFLNLVTPPCGCHLCASLQRRERLVLEGFRQAFPEKPQALVYRQQEIAGLERLERLGQSLYQPAIPELATAELAVPELVIPELVSL